MRRKLLAGAGLVLCGFCLGPFAGPAAAETLTLVADRSPAGEVLMQTRLQPGRLYRLVINGTGTSRFKPFGPEVVAPAPDFDPFYCFASSCHSSPPASHGLLHVNGAGIDGSLRVGEPVYFPPYNPAHVYEFFVYLRPDMTPARMCSLGGGGDGTTTFTPDDALYINGTSSWFKPCALISNTLERGVLLISAGSSRVGDLPGGLVTIATGSFDVSVSDVGPAPASPGVASAAPSPAKPKAGSQPAQKGAVAKGVVGKRYGVRSSGQGKVLSASIRFRIGSAMYKPLRLRVKLAGNLTYGRNGRGKNVAGTARIELVLKRQSGSGRDLLVLPFKYRLVSAEDTSASNTGESFNFKGTLLPPDVPPCRTLRITALQPVRVLSLRFCGAEASVPASISVA